MAKRKRREFSAEQKSEAVKLRTKMHRSQAVRVASFSAGSRAQSAGLQRGDLIRSYGGERVTDQLALRKAMQGRSASEALEVEIRRGRQDLVLDVPGGRLGIFVENARVPD